jgi:hypothetical protein
MCRSARSCGLFVSAVFVLVFPETGRAQILPGSFIDVSDDVHPDFTGIKGQYQSSLDKLSEANGIAIADFDSDGLEDVFLPNGKGRPNQLFKNQGDGTFVDVGGPAGVQDSSFATAMGLFIDYDNDGDRDLVTFSHAGDGAITYSPQLVRIFRNTGVAGGYTFVDVSAQCGFVLDPGTSIGTTTGLLGGATAGDYDRDGFLDLFVTYWQGSNGNDRWRLWRSAINPVAGDPNDRGYSPRVFVDSTVATGLDFSISPGKSWQPTFIDIDRDGWVDLHVSVDFGYDYMLLNDGGMRFVNAASDLGLNGQPREPRNEMGAAFGDVDGDGDMDIHLTNLSNRDRFYLNVSFGGQVLFVDVAPQTGLHNSPWGWGTIFFDYENDGDLDHASVSGFKLPAAFPYTNRLHINEHAQTPAPGFVPSFWDASAQVTEFSGEGQPENLSDRGLVATDLDDDGDLDLVVTRRFAPHAVYENSQTTANHYLKIDLRRQAGSLNVEHARVHLRANGRLQYREVLAGTSFLCQESPRLHFGLGSGNPVVDWAVVRWPNGKAQIVTGLAIDAKNVITEAAVDDRGDMDGDGHLTATDLAMLTMAAFMPTQFAAQHPNAPGIVTGDIDGNNLINRHDVRLYFGLPPH